LDCPRLCSRRCRFRFFYNGTLDRVNVDASGAVVAWAFVAIGEFCDKNGQEGFQTGTSDYIINYFLAPLGFPYTQNCGVEADPITGLNSYFSSIQSQFSNFNTTCRIFPTDTTVLRNGRKVTKYQFKCDVRVDYTGLWSVNATNINSCPDTQRKIGLLINIAGSAFDVDVSVDTNLNTRTGNVPDADSISFAAGKLKFAWDNYVVNTPSFSATTGTAARVTYGYIGAGNSAAAYNGASVVKQVIFSFSTPKSANQNRFYWDPVITADAKSIVPFFGVLLMICLNVLLLL